MSTQRSKKRSIRFALLRITIVVVIIKVRECKPTELDPYSSKGHCESCMENLTFLFYGPLLKQPISGGASRAVWRTVQSRK